MKEYSVSAITFENQIIDGADFDSPLYGHDYFAKSEPTLEEMKRSYGKGLEFVKKFVVQEMDINDDDNNNVVEKEYVLY